jgi:hypothetical protein
MIVVLKNINLTFIQDNKNMNKKLINEEIENIKYLLGYKPGKVISEQEQPEMSEDNMYLKRRLSTIEELINKYVNQVEEEETMFNDEFEFADNIISWVIDDLTNYDYDEKSYDELQELIKDNFGEYILSQYTELDDNDFDDDDEDYDDEDDF